ncbi:MAG: SMP-30/gluconolactonase/LRE family protein [Cyclobacteriaceae bacterium]|nr:SMP-30/gluconolactonase/LRE family protein [Cyclobacteriaceae bacterium]
MKHLMLCGLLSFSLACAGQTFEASLYQSTDHTAENLFSNNIEGPAVDKKGDLYVVNFQRDGTIGKVAPDGSVELFVTLPEGSTANSIQFNRKGNMYLADFTGHNVLHVDMKTRSVSVYVHNDQFNQPNDLCINRRGQLFASDPNWSNGTGKLWRVDRGGKAVLLADGMGTTNGIELNPDENILYVNESVQRKIWAFDVDRKGNLSKKRLFASFDDYGFDGMKCDREGNLYVTRYGKGVIAVLSPQGQMIREIPLTGKRCSNLVFGGADGKTVFVTLQDRKGIEKFRTSVPGRSWP